MSAHGGNGTVCRRHNIRAALGFLNPSVGQDFESLPNPLRLEPHVVPGQQLLQPRPQPLISASPPRTSITARPTRRGPAISSLDPSPVYR